VHSRPFASSQATHSRSSTRSFRLDCGRSNARRCGR
jgi:hypothetical protein